MRTSPEFRTGALVAFYTVQGVGVMLWWLVLHSVGASRSWFFRGGELDAVLASFMLPDLVVLGAGSIATAMALRRQASAARQLAWLVAGAALYAMLFTIHWTVTVDAPILSLVLMAVSGMGSLFCARQIV